MVRCIAADTPHAIAQAVQTLVDGALLGLPTETVYGLAADANNPAAKIAATAAGLFASAAKP